MNVYQALRERIRRIFGEYDYVYLSFSGVRTAVCC